MPDYLSVSESDPLSGRFSLTEVHLNGFILTGQVLIFASVPITSIFPLKDEKGVLFRGGTIWVRCL